VCESEFVDLTPNKPEKVGDVPTAAAAVVPGGSRKVPYTIHVSLTNCRILTLNTILSVYGEMCHGAVLYAVSNSFTLYQ